MLVLAQFSTSLRILAKAQSTWGGGDAVQKKRLLGGGTPHILSWHLGRGTPYIIHWWGHWKITLSRHLPETFQAPSRNLLDAFHIPYWHNPDTRGIPSPWLKSVWALLLFDFSVGGWVVPLENQSTSQLHLASWNLPDSQLSWESKMEPSVAKTWNRCLQAWTNVHKL